MNWFVRWIAGSEIQTLQNEIFNQQNLLESKDSLITLAKETIDNKATRINTLEFSLGEQADKYERCNKELNLLESQFKGKTDLYNNLLTEHTAYVTKAQLQIKDLKRQNNDLGLKNNQLESNILDLTKAAAVTDKPVKPKTLSTHKKKTNDA